jgi:lipoprotein-anchoring transpeptidase ErfK/SrfK
VRIGDWIDVFHVTFFVPLALEGENRMAKFRRLIWMVIAAVGLMLSASQSQAQLRQPDVGDQPGLITDDSVELDPEFRKTAVLYRTNEAPGTIIVATAERHLYLVQGNGRAIRYGIGVGREGFTWSGMERVTRMLEWPDWTPPEEMIVRQPYLPRFMAGGETNPLGARALYLGNTVYRIHGTNQPSTIGTFVSSGCIRLTNEDVMDLYRRVRVGTRIVVLPGRPPREGGLEAPPFNAARGPVRSDGTTSINPICDVALTLPPVLDPDAWGAACRARAFLCILA